MDELPLSAPARAAAPMTQAQAPAPAEVAEGVSPASSPSSSSAGFRKFRDLLMSRRFEDRDNEPVQVLPGLFIGSYGAASNKRALRAAGVTHILCASSTLALRFPDVFEYLRLSIADVDTEQISSVFPVALDFIDRALRIGGRVLVHCYVGRSRSVTLVLAYIMARQQMPLRDALAMLRRVRPQARPNAGFYRELVAYEAQLRESGVIVAAPAQPSASNEDVGSSSGFYLLSMRDME